jgi:hypothetical protein
LTRFVAISSPDNIGNSQEQERKRKECRAAGIAAETAGRGMAELAAWRDCLLVDPLALGQGRNS